MQVVVAFLFCGLCVAIAMSFGGRVVVSGAFSVMGSSEPDDQARVGAVAFGILAVFFLGAGVQSLFC